MREKTSSCLTHQHRPYFILCAVNQLEASEQTGREGARQQGGDRKRGNKPGRKKGTGLVGRQSNRPGINSERNRCRRRQVCGSVQPGFLFDILRRLCKIAHYQPLPFPPFPSLPTHPSHTFRGLVQKNKSQSTERKKKVKVQRNIIGIIAPNVAVRHGAIRG